MKVVLIITFLIHLCTAEIHSWGKKEHYAIYKIYERILIDDKSDIPKNYTIIHKYFGSYYKPVIYFEINVNADSNGYVYESKGQGVPLPYDLGTQTIQIFDAKVHVNGAKNVTATLTIYGIGYAALNIGGFFRKQQATKSLTYIYVKNASPVMKMKPFAQNSIGQRRQGDELIHFESRNVTNVSRFPSKSFEYSGSDANAYITYVGFSFNSPTAMAMLNTSYIGEQEFNAVVYDMNTEHFVANMSIYGIRSVFRPHNFLGVI